MNAKIKEIIENNSFVAVLGDIAGGNKVSELAFELEQLTAAVMATGKKGKLTLKLSLKPTGKGRVEIDAEVETKEPKLSQHSTIFFATHANQLTRDDPNQSEINFPGTAKAAGQ